MITAKALTASLTGTASKVYDGTTTATLTTGNFGLAGVLGTEAVSLTPVTTGTYDTKTVGTGKTVTVTGLTLTGTDSANYTLASTTVTGAIGTITAKALTASLTGTASKIYDGATTATLTTGNFSLTGVLGAEAVSLTPVTTGTYDTKAVGIGKIVTVTGLTLTGTDAANYMLASTTATGTIGTITAKTLVIQADDAQRPQGAPDPVFTARYDGFIGAEDRRVLIGTLAFETDATAASPAGQYAIMPGGVSAENYVTRFVAGTLLVTFVPMNTNVETIVGKDIPDAVRRPLPMLGGGPLPGFGLGNIEVEIAEILLQANPDLSAFLTEPPGGEERE
ncbi:YDG domain-containing protein [Zavarzinia compransoris]|uniref:MBG domain-containing protein n=2 Tax=Zavarzinia compransoris TaxID=1264899 RepID=A0A317ECA4_9PROT|nr:YDG domain-containing protein [Zavarzinia compransoris]PWR23003.1 hypothetical protein DKG75_00010 [Zavarzinia compransoris]